MTETPTGDPPSCDFSERSLEDSLCLYRYLFEHSGDVIVMVNPEGIIIELNPRFETETGYRKEEVVGKHFLSANLLTRDSLDQVRDKFQRLMTGVATEPAFDIEARTKDGRIVPFELQGSSIPGKDGKILAVQATFRGIARRKQYEKDLKDLKDFLETVVNAVPDPIFVKDHLHRWVVLNDAFCEFIGRSRKQLVGRSDFDFFPRREAEIFWKRDSQVFSSGQANVNKESFTDAAGRTHIILTRKQLFQYAGTGEKFLIGVIQIQDDRKGSKTGWGQMGKRVRGLMGK
ncbi:MAG: PAS domain S-box protein [Desulfobacterales bacterium]|nr:PAS domain S-box protein [Desulfobacterales bacterium]